MRTGECQALSQSVSLSLSHHSLIKLSLRSFWYADDVLILNGADKEYLPLLLFLFVCFSSLSLCLSVLTNLYTPLTAALVCLKGGDFESF